MTDTVVEDESGEQPVQAPSSAASDEQLISMLVDRARMQGLQLTKRVLESTLEGGITVGYDKHEVSGRGSGNSRNGGNSEVVQAAGKLGPGRGQPGKVRGDHRLP
ncbi:hypothetical protein GCM10010191_21690 [Actinomadura vinacea]|uniref:IS256 family transposase n=1 Tax=Actinomadura vinacea TaxID=115336 RepID=A0ABN3IRW6_9ACTN